MVQIAGTYRCERNANLDPFYLSLGMFYVERLLLCAETPTMQVNKNEEGCWNFTTNYATNIVKNTFKLNEEYEETSPNGKRVKSITTREADNLFVTKSKGVEDPTFTMEMHYEFTENGLIMTMTLPEASIPIMGKRYFKRIPSTVTSTSD